MTQLLRCAIFLAAALSAVAEPPDFTVHEWGTFTTVSGSDGILLPGLQREEEGMPPFVESHAGMENWGSVASNADGSLSLGKGWLRPLKNVTVKMETPVIYFYTSVPLAAKVSVDFHGGSISQWYPSRSGGEVPPGRSLVANAAQVPGFSAGMPLIDSQIDFAQPYEGSIQWEVAVTPPSDGDSAKIFHGTETPNWLFPRQTDSALVASSNGTADKFLFYRGVGNFELPIILKMERDRVLTIQNRGASSVPRLLIYELGDGRSARFQLLDALPAGKSIQVDLESLPAIGAWQKPVYNTLSEALRDAGLYRKEADAMLQTWWQSYFLKPGLRVFWIVPGDFLEKTLPLRIEPAPKNTCRVLVGRSEILTPEFERNLVKQQADANFYFWKNDRYSQAYAERVRQLDAH